MKAHPDSIGQKVSADSPDLGVSPHARGGFSLLGFGFLLLAIAFGSYIRIHTAFADPNFVTDKPDGLMRADPGLLYYMVSRVVEGKGLPPADFRADPRVEYPRFTDLPALDSVSQEFPIAWSYLLLGRGVPLHVFCLWFMGIFTSLRAVGVYLLALELTKKISRACVAVALYSLLPASYYTLGFILEREDFSYPFFFFHLALLARAARVRTSGSMILCAIPLVAALASWHGMSFLVTLEIACFFLWFLCTDENPFEIPRSWLVLVVVAGTSLLIPFLFRTAFVFSMPMRLALGLFAAAGLKGRGYRRLPTIGAAVAVVIGLGLFRYTFAADAYSHVWSLLYAKLRHLGELPADPLTIPFEARMMWQGPFATLPLAMWPMYFGAALWLFLAFVVNVVWSWFHGERCTSESLLAIFGLLALANTWLAIRVMSLPGILMAVGAVLLARQVTAHRLALAAMVGLVLAQGLLFSRFIESYRISWYDPPQVTTEYRALIEALSARVPKEEAVMADPVLSTAVLAQTRHPIILQPKWEEIEARQRFQEFVLTIFHGTPLDMKRLLSKYRCKYLVIDQERLWEATRYIAGLPLSQAAPDPGTAAALFLSPDSSAAESVPGFRLIFSYPQTVAGRDDQRPTRLLLYESIG